MTDPAPDPASRKTRNRIALVACGCSLLVAAFVLGLSHGHAWAGMVVVTLDRLSRLGPLGWGAFVGLQALVALIGFLPASLLGLAAGAVYGVGTGFALSAIGVLAGAAIAFWLARSTLRPTIIRVTERRAAYRRLDAALARDGWRLVLLMRISPVMPFSLTSFALGLSGVDFRSYISGTLASLPALLLYVCFGALGATGIVSARDGLGDLRVAVLGIGIAASIVLSVRVGRIIARAIRPFPEMQTPSDALGGRVTSLKPGE